jgi:TPR repeat protein
MKITTIILTCLISLSTIAIAEDSRETLVQIQKAANNNNPDAQIYWADKLLENNVDDKAVEYYTRAFTNQSATVRSKEQAARKLAEYYYSTGDFPYAGRWFIESANLNNHNSAYILSMMYFRGIGTDVDEQQSLKWMKQASQGRSGQYYQLLGQMYLLGIGQAKNEQLAIDSLEKAIQRDNVVAMIILGLHYKINNMNNERANELLLTATKMDNNFLTNYLNTSRNSTFSSSTLNNADGESLLLNKTNDIDKKLVQYYNQLVSTFPNMGDVTNF